MSAFKLDVPIEIGGLVIFPGDPPAGFKPAAGKRYFSLDTADPLFAAFASQAEASGFSRDEFHNAIALYAHATEKAGDAEGVDASAVHERLGTVIGDDARHFRDVVRTPQQAAALGLVVDHLAKQQGAPAATPGAKPTVTVEQLREKMSDPKYWRDHDPVLHAEVAAGFQALYGNEPPPADRVLNPTRTPRQEPPPAGAVDPLVKASLDVMVRDPRYNSDKTFRAGADAAFKAAYPGETRIGFGAGEFGSLRDPGNGSVE